MTTTSAAVLSAEQLKTVALKLLASEDRAGKLPDLPVGTLGAASFALQVTADSITVNPAEMVDATTSISRVLVAMAFEAALQDAMTAALATITTKNGAAVAEAVLSAFGADSAKTVVAGIVSDATKRWNTSDKETDAAKARWERSFKGKVTGQRLQNGKSFVKGVVNVAR